MPPGKKALRRRLQLLLVSNPSGQAPQGRCRFLQRPDPCV